MFFAGAVAKNLSFSLAFDYLSLSLLPLYFYSVVLRSLCTDFLAEFPFCCCEIQWSAVFFLLDNFSLSLMSYKLLTVGSHLHFIDFLTKGFVQAPEYLHTNELCGSYALFLKPLH